MLRKWSTEMSCWKGPRGNRSSRFRHHFFDFILEKHEINRIPECTAFYHEMLKIASVSEAPLQTPLRSLRRSLRTPSLEGQNNRKSQIRAFAACNFNDSIVLVGIPASRPWLRLSWFSQPRSSGHATGKSLFSSPKDWNSNSAYGFNANSK